MSGLTTEDTENTELALTIFYRWIERNHPDGFIDSLTFSQNLERVTDRWYDRFDQLERERDKWRSAAVELRSACFAHYSKEDQEQTAEGFIRVLQAADRISEMEDAK